MKFVIRKVPLFTFITLLKEIYESGADYVDLNGYRNEAAKQDEITVSVPLEYMVEEAEAKPEKKDIQEDSSSIELYTYKDIVDIILNS